MFLYYFVNGLNRFKSGFIADNFAGHRVGDVLHPDYKASIDMIDNEMINAADICKFMIF